MISRGLSLRHIRQSAVQKLIWKANENDPLKHNASHLSLYYQFPTEPTEVTKIMGSPHVFNSEYNKFLRTIGMTPIMIRQPALDIMKHIEDNTSHNDCENQKIILYGDPGHGKTQTLAHVLHYIQSDKRHFLIHFRWLKRFTLSPKEYNVSTSRPGRIDTPLDAALLLHQIRTQNEALLTQYKDTLVCSQDYKWSAREETKAGEPLEALIDHGINRVIHASDCLAVLLKELMIAADSGKIKLLSVIRRANFLFHYRSGSIKHPDYKWILVDEMTVARAIKKLIKGSHKNSLVIASCDDKLSNSQNQTPETVLPEDGIEYFRDSKRILVPKFNRIEFENCMNMYQDIGWLSRPESKTPEVRDELRFISGMNPYEVYMLCKAL